MSTSAATSIVSGASRSWSTVLFLGWAVLAWASVVAISIFTVSASWREFPNLIAAFGGSCVILWGTRSVLRRDGETFAFLGLDWRGRYWSALAVALLAGTVVVLLPSIVLTFARDARWEIGTASWSYALGVLLAYSVASFVEEFIFRGYLLRRLTGFWGRGWALGAIALAFGLFHLPGLSGVAAVKMVCTTGACSLLFSALVLRSGTLWSAVAAHAVMNWMLHTVLGVTGKTAFFQPVFEATNAEGIDVGFWSLLIVVAGGAWWLLPQSSTAGITNVDPWEPRNNSRSAASVSSAAKES